MPEPGTERNQPRLILMLAAVAITVALVGLVTGIRPDRYQAQRAQPRVAADPGDVPPARSHAELESHPWGKSPVRSGWTRSVQLSGLSRPVPTDEEIWG